MSNVWQVQDARARFSELLEASLVERSQIVTRRGIETAVLIPVSFRPCRPRLASQTPHPVIPAHAYLPSFPRKWESIHSCGNSRCFHPSDPTS